LNCGKKLTKEENEAEAEFCSQCQEEGYTFEKPDEEEEAEEEPEVAVRVAKKVFDKLAKPWLPLIPFGLSFAYLMMYELSISKYHPLADIFGYPFVPKAHFFAIATFVTAIFTLRPRKGVKHAIGLILAGLWAVLVSLYLLNAAGDFFAIVIIGLCLAFIYCVKDYI
jgi:ABC-type branched-subunit amino acid transport system permease subunit